MMPWPVNLGGDDTHGYCKEDLGVEMITRSPGDRNVLDWMSIPPTSDKLPSPHCVVAAVDAWNSELDLSDIVKYLWCFFPQFFEAGPAFVIHKHRLMFFLAPVYSDTLS
jgi:hypothetical protein